MEHLPEKLPKLSKNQALVLAVLTDSAGPLSAYSILDLLRNEGIRAPLQVYRALEKLVEYGSVHRLESINAFVACQHPECESNTMVGFTICDNCGEVNEISDRELESSLNKLAATSGFKLKKSMVELVGRCDHCGW